MLSVLSTESEKGILPLRPLRLCGEMSSSDVSVKDIAGEFEEGFRQEFKNVIRRLKGCLPGDELIFF